LLPERSLPLDRARRRVVPRYLTEADHVWLDELRAECERHVGCRRGELEQRLSEPLTTVAPRDKLLVASRVLLRHYEDRIESPRPPATIRKALFAARVCQPTRALALQHAADELQISPEDVEAHLFADLPSERRVAPLSEPLSSTELALRVNHAIVASLLRRATVVRIQAEGNVRALVSAVKLRGLLCVAEPTRHGKSVTLSISGPYALFRNTLVYGRALSSLIPRVARCQRFLLRATCALSNGLVEFTIRSGDPVVPSAPGKAYDSKLEERFAKDFGKLARDWDVIREPQAVSVDDGWIFPDFLLRHRTQRERWALLEIVGFWTPEYLRRKLDGLDRVRLPRFILCIDENRNCSDDEFPPQARIIRFKRRIPAAEVLRALETFGGHATRHNPTSSFSEPLSRVVDQPRVEP